MILTKAEEALILEKRKQEDTDSPKKSATLKHDLYDYHDYPIPPDDWHFTEETKQKYIQEFTNNFKIIARKGHAFVCYIDKGQEQWYDYAGEFEGLDKSWARKNLENIKDL